MFSNQTLMGLGLAAAASLYAYDRYMTKRAIASFHQYEQKKKEKKLYLLRKHLSTQLANILKNSGCLVEDGRVQCLGNTTPFADLGASFSVEEALIYMLMKSSFVDVAKSVKTSGGGLVSADGFDVLAAQLQDIKIGEPDYSVFPGTCCTSRFPDL